MSSKPEAQNEPTMEEILASIRRIISEDEPQEGKAAAPAPAPKAAESAPAPQAPAAASPVGGPGADNILDLTKMVAEDGSIVDLAAQQEEAVEEAPAEAEADQEAAAEEAPEEAAAEPEAEAVEDFAAEEQIAEEPAAEEPAPAAEAAEELADEPMAEEEPEEPAEEEAPEMAAAADLDEEVSPGQALAPASDDDNEYISPETATAATASLAAVTKAAMANRQGGAIAIGGGRTLEELVRESLAPELKGWLDENLPDLVERIVREEIRKMVRRAEDQ